MGLRPGLSYWFCLIFLVTSGFSFGPFVSNALGSDAIDLRKDDCQEAKKFLKQRGVTSLGKKKVDTADCDDVITEARKRGYKTQQDLEREAEARRRQKAEEEARAREEQSKREAEARKREYERQTEERRNQERRLADELKRATELRAEEARRDQESEVRKSDDWGVNEIKRKVFDLESQVNDYMRSIHSREELISKAEIVLKNAEALEQNAHQVRANGLIRSSVALGDAAKDMRTMAQKLKEKAQSMPGPTTPSTSTKRKSQEDPWSTIYSDSLKEIQQADKKAIEKGLSGPDPVGNVEEDKRIVTPTVKLIQREGKEAVKMINGGDITPTMKQRDAAEHESRVRVEHITQPIEEIADLKKRAERVINWQETVKDAQRQFIINQSKPVFQAIEPYLPPDSPIPTPWDRIRQEVRDEDDGGLSTPYDLFRKRGTEAHIATPYDRVSKKRDPLPESTLYDSQSIDLRK